MKIIIEKNYEKVSCAAAEFLAETVKKNPFAVLGLATGSTPVGAYKRLAEACKRGELSFKNVKTFNLDEYVGLGECDAQSYVTFMRENLFSKVDIDLNNTFLPDGKAKDLDAECKRYSALIGSLTRDVQLLGLGRNGHIGFNEPYTPFDSVTHVVELTADTVQANSRLFDDIAQVPRKAVTMGIAEIMKAKRILLVATGKDKAHAVRAAVKGEITPAVPASVLQNHADVTVILDEEAASELH